MVFEPKGDLTSIMDLKWQPVSLDGFPKACESPENESSIVRALEDGHCQLEGTELLSGSHVGSGPKKVNRVLNQRLQVRKRREAQ